MTLATIDWGIIIGFLTLILIVGSLYTRRASQNIEQFFLGGRNLPWWLAGISMVATTFAADTPLAVTELVLKNGIAGNWLWWNFLAGGMLTTFFFARLWQRAGVLTEVELIELRYSGKPAQWLRGFKAIYLGIFMNVIVLAWVNVALQTLLIVFFDISESTALWYTAGAMLLAAVYTTLSGLVGIAVTDALQFVVAMIGCVALAYFVLSAPEIGGLSGLTEQLHTQNPRLLHFLPTLDSSSSVGTTLGLSITGFLAFAGFQWWACWYPGAEPGGGGYVAQRMMSTRSSKDAVYATLFFQVAHYCIRPWAWIVVALAAFLLYPDLAAGDERYGYVYAMRDYLPAGWRGLLLVAFLAAYMSTISTQLNWGASYLVNDVYRRFVQSDASEKRLVLVSRVSTLVLLVLGVGASYFVQSISGAWGLLLQTGAGLGLVLILRWYWWRINVWSEWAATLAPFVFTGLFWGYEFQTGTDLGLPVKLISTTILTTLVWLVVTQWTRPEPDALLQAFWQRVHGTVDYRRSAPAAQQQRRSLALAWGAGVVFTYSLLFAVGKFLLQAPGMGFSLLLIAVGSWFALLKGMKGGGIMDDNTRVNDTRESIDDILDS